MKAFEKNIPCHFDITKKCAIMIVWIFREKQRKVEISLLFFPERRRNYEELEKNKAKAPDGAFYFRKKLKRVHVHSRT